MEELLLKVSVSPFYLIHPHIHPEYQRNPIVFGVTGFKVNVTTVKCAKTVSDE